MHINKQAFTLIELLVVVLIIGILTAVALPQYRVAVAKSRLSSAKMIVNGILKAQEIYHFANGSYTKMVEDLDIDLPGGQLDSTVSQSGTSDNKYIYDWGSCQLSGNRVCCTTTDDISYCAGYLQHTGSTAGRRCVVWNTNDTTDWRNRVCKAETSRISGTLLSSPKVITWKY